MSGRVFLATIGLLVVIVILTVNKIAEREAGRTEQVQR